MPPMEEGNDSNNNAARPNAAHEKLKQTAAFAKGFADNVGGALGNLIPTASLQQMTTRKYTLPDKTVASQVLMYRQLLHTKCRPGLKLSRDFQATAAQRAVMHMPWWEEGIEESKKMVISYDNLISRLWLNGAIEPFLGANESTKQSPDLLDMDGPDVTSAASVETFIDDKGLPPIPHTYWVERLGFQQPDPVTDFRSGGVLSLAMMVYMVETHPQICKRFFTGDAAVLPFGITCINVTDMIAKFLMLAKSTDRMDALLSQKPFWRMFADPNAILAVQELAMTMLCDVVVEIGRERQIPYLAKQHSSNNTGIPADESSAKVTVFDFSTILERTERRVRDDLLGAGPKTVDELRSIAGRLRVKYNAQMDRAIQRAEQQQKREESGPTTPIGGAAPVASPQIKDVLDKAGGAAGAVAGAAGAFAGGLIAKMKNPGVSFGGNKDATASEAPGATPTIVDLPPPSFATTEAAPSTPVSTAPGETEGDWAGTDIAPATEGISNFSIGDDDDDDFL